MAEDHAFSAHLSGEILFNQLGLFFFRPAAPRFSYYFKSYKFEHTTQTIQNFVVHTDAAQTGYSWPNFLKPKT